MWPIAELSDVASVFNGKTPAKDEQRHNGHPVLKIKDVDDNGLFKGQFNSYIDHDLFEKFEHKKIIFNDTLILNAAHNSDYVSSKQYCAESAVVNSLPTGEWLVVRANENKLNAKFLNYWLASEKTKFQIKQLVKGIHLYPKDVARLKIPLPPLSEQKRIAAILDKADAIRRKRQQAIQLADEFLRAVFLDMFGDPVMNPKGWEVKKLNEGINKIRSGWSAKGADYPCTLGQVGVLKISSVTSGIFIPSENKYVDEQEIPSNKNLIFPKKGDLLFSRANTRELVAATCVVPETRKDVFLPDKLWLVELNDKILLPEFLHFLIKTPRFRATLTAQATGTSGSMLNISKDKFERTTAIFPDVSLQEKFKAIYWNTQKLLTINQDFAGKIAEQNNAISQKAFSGKL